MLSHRAPASHSRRALQCGHPPSHCKIHSEVQVLNFKHWLLSRDLLNSTCPVSAEETELLQKKILSPPATCCSLFVPSSATLTAERSVLTRFACSGFGSAPTAPASSRAGPWAGTSSWGSGHIFRHFSHLKVSSYLARRTGRAGGAAGGDYTNHLSASCFLHELAQQKAIFRLKCF